MKKDRKILDEVSDYMRLHHYSIHTERSYCDWIRRFVRFRRMASRKDLKDGEPKIERFLTHLAVDGHLSPAAQNQTMNAWYSVSQKYRILFKFDGERADCENQKTTRKTSEVLGRSRRGAFYNYPNSHCVPPV